MKELLKDEYEAYEASFKSPSFHGLRVNTNKISTEEFLNIFPYELERVPWTSDGFYYKDESISKHPYFYAGLYYLQEPSAMLPAEVLPVNSNDYVLDTCAAPGGKSTKLAVKLNGTGLLVSNDISASRQQATLRNLEKFGIRNSFVTSASTTELANKYKETFDAILVDAPCSGEGMFRKDSSLISSWIKQGPEYYAPIQKEIIRDALSMLKPGGHLVYSTCTFDPREDEEVIEYALSLGDITVEPIKEYPGFVQNEYGTKLFPHKVKGEGHFVSLLKKKGNRTDNPVSLNSRVPEYLEKLNIDFSHGVFETIKDSLYFHPDFSLSGIRTLRSGLLVGEIKNGRFEPSQPLAMSLKKDEFTNVIDFKVEDERVIRYLKGETINVSDYDNTGWVLVRVDGYPLGFGKVSDHQLKNKIAKGWTYL